MKFGLSDIYLEQIKSAFSSIPEIDEVVIYGSRARGDYSPTSDIDITLKGKGLTISHLSRLDNALDDLLMPYSFDICIFDKIRDEQFLSNVIRDGKTLYLKQDSEYTHSATVADDSNI